MNEVSIIHVRYKQLVYNIQYELTLSILIYFIFLSYFHFHFIYFLI